MFVCHFIYYVVCQRMKNPLQCMRAPPDVQAFLNLVRLVHAHLRYVQKRPLASGSQPVKMYFVFPAIVQRLVQRARNSVLGLEVLRAAIYMQQKK